MPSGMGGLERHADGHYQVTELDGLGQQQQGNVIVHVESLKVFVPNYVGDLHALG